MGSLEPIEELSRHISHRLPDAQLSIDAPQDPSGNWYVDVQFESHTSVIEWRPRLGFGVSFELAGYGEGPEVVFSSATEAADYLANKLTQGRPARILLASIDNVWREQLLDELTRHQLAAKSAADYGKALALLEQQNFDIVIVDVHAGPMTADYAALNDVLKETSSLVVAIGTIRPDDSPGEWFEVFVRKVIAPAQIASIVESLATHEQLSVVQ
jgi:CheY-like chemotaxis protein